MTTSILTAVVRINQDEVMLQQKHVSESVELLVKALNLVPQWFRVPLFLLSGSRWKGEKQDQ